MYFKVFVCHNICCRYKFNGEFVFLGSSFLGVVSIPLWLLIRQVQSHKYCFLVFWLFDHETIPVGTQ